MSFASSLLDSTWIASPLYGGPRTGSPAPYLRTQFFIDSPVRTARLLITALGLYECEINGKTVTDSILSPGWTDYRKRLYFQSYDVTAHLTSGDNVIGVVLGDGWYCGYVGCWDRQTYGSRPQLLACLEIEFMNGTRKAVRTDSSWKTATSPILANDLLMGESYDARREINRWSEAGPAGGIWTPVLTMKAPTIIVEASRGTPVRRMEELRPISVRVFPARWLPDPSTVYDFGQNFSGRVRIFVRAPQGTTVTLSFAEVLNPDGTLYRDNLRGALATDHYTCRGGDLEVWEPKFTFHGFRYMEVFGLKSGDHFECKGIVLHSQMKSIGKFSCSHELLNRLQENIVWGQKSNFIDIPMDCPQRDERLGWTGDAQVFIRTACFNMDVRKFFEKWFQDLRDAQGEEGRIPCIAPSDRRVAVTEAGPAWADAVILCPWILYLCFGEPHVLREHYESMHRYMHFVETTLCLDYIRSHPEIDSWGGFGDWLAVEETPKDLIGTAFFAHDAEIMAKIALLLERKREAEHYRLLHVKIVSAFRQRFLSGDGSIECGTQTAYVLALHFGLVPDGLRKNASAQLVKNIRKREFHLTTGFVGTPYILHVLEESGDLDVAYRLLEQETFPSWLFPVKMGATTIWERWDGWTPEKGFQDKIMNSFNHYAYGAVGAWMYRCVAGLDLDPAEPGYRHIIFRPRPGGSITSAEASLETPYGEASISWKLINEFLHVFVKIPAGSYATFLPPPGFVAEVEDLQAGDHAIIAHPAGHKIEAHTFPGPSSDF